MKYTAIEDTNARTGAISEENKRAISISNIDSIYDKKVDKAIGRRRDVSPIIPRRIKRKKVDTQVTVSVVRERPSILPTIIAERETGFGRIR